MGNPIGCDIGQMLRDDFSTEILKTASEDVRTALRWYTEQVSVCTEAILDQSRLSGGDSAEKLEYKIQQLTKKKESLLRSGPIKQYIVFGERHE